MKIIFLFTVLFSLTVFADTDKMISQKVFVESTTDTDNDGKLDRIYVSISRPRSNSKLSTIFEMSPYSLGGNSTTSHGVDTDLLPQDESLFSKKMSSNSVRKYFDKNKNFVLETFRIKYAKVSAHSLGTGYSSGCPTVGDMSEALGAKAVINWLNGTAKAYDKNGVEVKADWANGKVGMSGVSYNGTLPIMVAATGVKGLKAIIPVAAISNWYNYYRANGLVVGPGGYIGEDADELGSFIVRKNACKKELKKIAKNMARESGDYTTFWQKRNYLPLASNIKAATFIIHGQSDWNVKQKHATDLWNAIENAPKRMYLHSGGHSLPRSNNTSSVIRDWYDHFLEGVDNGVTNGDQVAVQLNNKEIVFQKKWPSEKTSPQVIYLGHSAQTMVITDNGKKEKLSKLIKKPLVDNNSRAIFISRELTKNTLLSGESNISLSLSVLNRKAANITVALVEYTKRGESKIITRGWADPQNHSDLVRGELLVPGNKYLLKFNLEPKQYLLSKGSQLGVVLASTDYNYTIRPNPGTQIEFHLGSKSFIELMLSEQIYFD